MVASLARSGVQYNSIHANPLLAAAAARASPSASGTAGGSTLTKKPTRLLRATSKSLAPQPSSRAVGGGAARTSHGEADGTEWTHAVNPLATGTTSASASAAAPRAAKVLRSQQSTWAASDALPAAATPAVPPLILSSLPQPLQRTASGRHLPRAVSLEPTPAKDAPPDPVALAHSLDRSHQLQQLQRQGSGSFRRHRSASSGGSGRNLLGSAVSAASAAPIGTGSADAGRSFFLRNPLSEQGQRQTMTSAGAAAAAAPATSRDRDRAGRRMLEPQTPRHRPSALSLNAAAAASAQSLHSVKSVGSTTGAALESPRFSTLAGRRMAAGASMDELGAASNSPQAITRSSSGRDLTSASHRASGASGSGRTLVRSGSAGRSGRELTRSSSSKALARPSSATRLTAANLPSVTSVSRLGRQLSGSGLASFSVPKPQPTAQFTPTQADSDAVVNNSRVM
jgi:hypothetical protein